MQALTGRIPTRTEHQAMDWSLVLASQGIEAIIEHEPVADTWQLLVPSPDYTRALQCLRQYLKENRGSWRPHLPPHGLIFDWRGVDWRAVVPMFFLILIYAADTHGALKAAGVMSSAAVRSGEWWRLFTAVTLHVDPVHLAANVTIGLLFIGLSMGALGAGLGILAPFLAGAFGNLVGLAVYGPSHQGMGASGMILGALGLVTAYSSLLFRHSSAPGSLALRAGLSGCFLFILTGLSAQRNVDLIAHLAGFAAGIAMGALLSWRPDWIRTDISPQLVAAELGEAPSSRNPRIWVDRVALCLSLLAFAVPWSFALRHMALLLAAGVACLVVLALTKITSQRDALAASEASRSPGSAGPGHV